MFIFDCHSAHHVKHPTGRELCVECDTSVFSWCNFVNFLSIHSKK